MPPPRHVRLPASFDDEAFALDVRRYGSGSRGLLVAQAARAQFERSGVPLDRLLRCENEGPEGTRLTGLLKIYLPIAGATAGDRPFGMVFDLVETDDGPVLSYVAFGVREQMRGSRAQIMYAIAQRRLDS